MLVFRDRPLIKYVQLVWVLAVHASPAPPLYDCDTKVKDRDSRLLRAKELLQSKLASKNQELEAALVGRDVCVCVCACCVPLEELFLSALVLIVLSLSLGVDARMYVFFLHVLVGMLDRAIQLAG